MDNLEEGELPSSPEESEVDDTPYNPLPRPENLHTNRNAKTTKDDHENNSAMADDADEEEGDFGILNNESSDSDSDLEGNFGPKRRFEPPPTSKHGNEIVCHMSTKILSNVTIYFICDFLKMKE